MILDLGRFVETERPHWTALEKTLDWLASDPNREMSIADLERFHALYQRTSADLAKVATLHSESELRQYLEWLVGRAYSEIHETRERRKFRPWRWLAVEFPRAFRRHIQAFQLAVALTVMGGGVRRRRRTHRFRGEKCPNAVHRAAHHARPARRPRTGVEGPSTRR